ncbi:molybdate ABC transporter substrate-binding protein [Thiopseudomonas denitrificans]|uniref:Molybdate transport system substrate-binding protein n=1 Tax=Thiopseudomonas denitrificans TaxID=1501432 RepID=A0A4R6U0D4_9GAMM|nr:molybdate ABC transporter substrate-binding protein [Thiopseudomonas denitrificans]TDQ37819.1 molybdate transport system substrate-binding protein [Thiopseudomonas denitrificans]
MKPGLPALLLACWMPLAGAAEITLSAAASLSNAFKDIAAAFEQERPEHRVQLNFAASGVLLQQMAHGAPVDIFASADQATMDQARDLDLLDNASRRDFVSNSLVLITPMNGQPLQTLEDLRQPVWQRIAVSNPDSVPVGRYSRDVLTGLQLWDALQDKFIQTQNVRHSLDYVARGEVDAGFVYATDAALMADKVSVQLTVPTATPVLYPVAITAPGTHNPASHDFIDYLFAPASQAILQRYGFGTVQ